MVNVKLFFDYFIVYVWKFVLKLIVGFIMGGYAFCEKFSASYFVFGVK